MGITDLNKKYELKEIVKGDSIFCASAITNSMSMKGVISEENTYYATETLVTFKSLNDNNKSIEKRRIGFDHLEN